MNNLPSNGSKRPRHGAVGNLANFFRDLVSLIELQGLLFLVDAGDEFRKSRNRLLLTLFFSGVCVSCLPLGLAGVALILAEETRLTVGQALLCVAATGFTLACGGIYTAVQWALPGTQCLERSRAEWKYNINWMKDTLKHLGDGATDSCTVSSDRLRR